MKYKNKDGIELNHTGNDYHTELVREVILKACKLTKMYDKDCIMSHKMALRNVRKFLTENFDMEEEWKY